MPSLRPDEAMVRLILDQLAPADVKALHAALHAGDRPVFCDLDDDRIGFACGPVIATINRRDITDSSPHTTP